MNGKSFGITIVIIVISIILSRIGSMMRTESQKQFQEKLEQYNNSSLAQHDSNASLHLVDDALTSKEQHEESVFPTKEEIDAANAKLPFMVAEGTLFTKVEYNEKTRVQTFSYRFTQEIDESLITEENIQPLKAKMVYALVNSPNSLKRLNAGVTYLYRYHSVDDRKLYEIKIDSSNFN